MCAGLWWRRPPSAFFLHSVSGCIPHKVLQSMIDTRQCRAASTIAMAWRALAMARCTYAPMRPRCSRNILEKQCFRLFPDCFRRCLGNNVETVGNIGRHRSCPRRCHPCPLVAKHRKRFQHLGYAVFTRLVVCSGPRHADADVVGMVHAHDLDASTAVCGLVSEIL